MSQPTVTPITTYDVVNTLNSGLQKPDYWENMVSKFPGSFGKYMMQFYESIGFKKVAYDTTVRWWEDDFIQSEIQVAAPGFGPAAGAGLSLAVTIAAASHDASGTRTPVRVDDIVLVKDGVDVIPCRVRSINTTTPNAHIMTIWPQDVTKTIPNIAANDMLFTATRQRAEGVGQPSALTPILTEYSNDLMIIDESYRATGTVTKTRVWPKIMTASKDMVFPSGVTVPKGGQYIFIKGADETYWRYEEFKDSAMLHSVRTTNQTNMGDTARSTNGLIPEIIAGGNIWNWSPGNLSISWFDQWHKQIKRNFGAREYHGWLGIDLYQAVQNFFATAFTNGALNYGSFAKSEKLALAYEFASFKKNEINFKFKMYDKWHHPRTYGNTNYRFDEMGLFIPADTVTDPKTNQTTPGFCLRYLEDRENMSWTTGARAPVNKTEIDELNIHFKCEIGIMAPARNRYWLVRPSS